MSKLKFNEGTYSPDLVRSAIIAGALPADEAESLKGDLSVSEQFYYPELDLTANVIRSTDTLDDRTKAMLLKNIMSSINHLSSTSLIDTDLESISFPMDDTLQAKIASILDEVSKIRYGQRVMGSVAAKVAKTLLKPESTKEDVLQTLNEETSKYKKKLMHTLGGDLERTIISFKKDDKIYSLDIKKLISEKASDLLGKNDDTGRYAKYEFAKSEILELSKTEGLELNGAQIEAILMSADQGSIGSAGLFSFKHKANEVSMDIGDKRTETGFDKDIVVDLSDGKKTITVRSGQNINRLGSGESHAYGLRITNLDISKLEGETLIPGLAANVSSRVTLASSDPSIDLRMPDEIKSSPREFIDYVREIIALDSLEAKSVVVSQYKKEHSASDEQVLELVSYSFIDPRSREEIDLKGAAEIVASNTELKKSDIEFSLHEQSRKGRIESNAGIGARMKSALKRLVATPTKHRGPSSPRTPSVASVASSETAASEDRASPVFQILQVHRDLQLQTLEAQQNLKETNLHEQNHHIQKSNLNFHQKEQALEIQLLKQDQQVHLEHLALVELEILRGHQEVKF